MSNAKNYDRHTKLVDRMAATQGVDIDEVVQRGDLPNADLRDAVYTCVGCSDVNPCEHWLDGHGKGAADTPSYCRNADLFKELKA